MTMKQYAKKVETNVAVINKLWGNLLQSFEGCSIPASESRLFGLSAIAFEGYMQEVKELSKPTFSNKEKFGEQLLDAAVAAAVLLRYIGKTASSQDIVIETKKGWIEKAINATIFDIIEDTQNFIMKK